MFTEDDRRRLEARMRELLNGMTSTELRAVYRLSNEILEERYQARLEELKGV